MQFICTHVSNVVSAHLVDLLHKLSKPSLKQMDSLSLMRRSGLAISIFFLH